MNMRGIGTRRPAGVYDRHDVAIVRLVHACQASAGEESAGDTSQNPHITRFRLRQRAQSLIFSLMGLIRIDAGQPTEAAPSPAAP